MKFIADLQIHSKYSRATSQDMVLEEIDRRAADKGILVMGTGDFTHPAWFREIKEKLEPAEPGLFRLKKEFKQPTLRGDLAETRFLLSAEISNIYSRPHPKTGQKKVYRVHNLIFAPDLATVEKINTRLGWIGNLASDGRPILGLDSRELVKIVLEINPQAVIVPAHAWTPWFSLFGSMSGFDSLEECFGEYRQYIFAIETGLSSDPAMNWRLSQLDHIALISNSDSHSLKKIGREANIFEVELSYDNIMEAIRSRNPQKFLATIEFFPEEGKYHFDGHRLCEIVFSPEETKAHQGLCPKCGRPLTIGVMSRVEELADRPPPSTERRNGLHYYENRIPYYRLVPLDELIASVYGLGPAAKKVQAEYNQLIKLFGGELEILTNTPPQALEAGKVDPRIIDGLEAVRRGAINFRPGFDGEYGKMTIALTPRTEEQKSLF